MAKLWDATRQVNQPSDKCVSCQRRCDKDATATMSLPDCDNGDKEGEDGDGIDIVCEAPDEDPPYYYCDSNFQVVKKTVSGSEIISQNTVRQGQVHWGCHTLEGVPLEDQGRGFCNAYLSIYTPAPHACQQVVRLMHALHQVDVAPAPAIGSRDT